MNNSTELSHFPIPTPIISDYVRIGVNALCFIFGLPINLLTLYRQLKRPKHRKSRGKINILHVNLNISDLLILIFYSFGQVCWLLTWKWLGGDIGCRFMRFMESVAFSFSSNIIVCIALNRLHAMIHPLQAHTWEAARYTKRSLYIAWALAFVTSSPQLGTYELFVFPGTTWGQCVSIWFSAYVLNQTSSMYTFWQRFYSIYHVLVLFWIPLVCLLICYALILREICPRIDLLQGFLGRGRPNEEQHNFELRSSGIHRGSPITADPTSDIDDDSNVGEDLRRDSTAPRKSRLISQFSAAQTAASRSCSTFSGSNAGITLRLVSGQASRKKTRNRTVRITLILLTLYIVLWLPYNAISLWTVVDMESFIPFEDQIYILLALELVVVNSVVNPLVYGTLKFNDCTCRKNEDVAGASVKRSPNSMSMPSRKRESQVPM